MQGGRYQAWYPWIHVDYTAKDDGCDQMTAEMTADYIMIIWLVEMTAEMTAGRFC